MNVCNEPGATSPRNRTGIGLVPTLFGGGSHAPTARSFPTRKIHYCLETALMRPPSADIRRRGVGSAGADRCGKSAFPPMLPKLTNHVTSSTALRGGHFAKFGPITLDTKCTSVVLSSSNSALSRSQGFMHESSARVYMLN